VIPGELLMVLEGGEMQNRAERGKMAKEKRAKVCAGLAIFPMAGRNCRDSGGRGGDISAIGKLLWNFQGLRSL
jgi:hypothetical protein